MCVCVYKKLSQMQCFIWAFDLNRVLISHTWSVPVLFCNFYRSCSAEYFFMTGQGRLEVQTHHTLYALVNLDLSFTIIVQTSEENIRVFPPLLTWKFGFVCFPPPLGHSYWITDISLIQFWFQEVALVDSEYQRKRLRGSGDGFICPAYSPAALAPFLRDWQLQNGRYLQT